MADEGTARLKKKSRLVCQEDIGKILQGRGSVEEKIQGFVTSRCTGALQGFANGGHLTCQFRRQCLEDRVIKDGNILWRLSSPSLGFLLC